MLGYLILAILIGFIAVDIIRSRPKPQPKVTKEETLECDNPKPEIPAPKETLKCDKPEPAISIPENMTLPERLKHEQGLRKQGFNIYERAKHCKIEIIGIYLKSDNLSGYMRSVVEKAYRYRSEAELLHPPEDYTFVSVSESIQLLNELYSSSKGEELGIKPKYIEGLKKSLQSDTNSWTSYYAALEYIYYHLRWEANPNAEVKMELKILDDAELYKIFKDSIPKRIDFLKRVSYGIAKRDGYTLYEFAQKVDKMFCSAREQRKLPVPE